jgi:hypothetical protein
LAKLMTDADWRIARREKVVAEHNEKERLAIEAAEDAAQGRGK